MKRALWIALCVIFAALIAAGCGGKDNNDSNKGSDKDRGGGGGLPAATADDWATYGYDLRNTRNVPHTQITPQNVKDLGLAWSVDLQKEVDGLPGGQQTTALKLDDTLYVSTSYNHVFALDAKDGSVKWHWAPDNIGVFKNFGVTANRGVAICDDAIFEATLDMHIVKLDPDTGKLIKRIAIEDIVPEAKSEYGYYESSAPICYKDKLYLGASGGDNGVRGFVMAYNAKDLTAAWDNPLYTVPAEGQGWRKSGRFHGGGAVWTPVTIDEETGLVYFSSGNPSPDFFAQLRPGNNPDTNTLFAVDAETGDVKWKQQQIKSDQWDYDTAQPPMVFDAKLADGQRRVASVGTKEGLWFYYDAKTGEPLNGSGLQVVDEFDHQPLVPGKSVTVSPSTLGGVNYAPQSFDPTTNIAVVASIDSKSELTQVKSADEVDKDRVRGDVDTGAVNGFGSTPKGWHDSGNVYGIDMTTGKVKWKVDTPEPERGGTTTTASGLGFVGGGDGVLRAIDLKSGKVVWSFQTGAQIAAAPTIYMYGGDEYVVIPIGGTFTSSQGGKMSKILAFKLGGDKTQLQAPNLKPADNGGGEITKSDNPLQSYLTLTPDKKVQITVVGAAGSQGGGMNFNGYARGSMTFTVPTDSKVVMVFRNGSDTVPHSAMVTGSDEVNKAKDFSEAFDGSAMPDAATGIQSGSAQFEFTADKAGTYAIVCAVPGHSAAGMWITFKVEDGVKPSVSTKDGKNFTLDQATGANAMVH
jgi:PQQ-dependent dehydrogenase (methanol/ethanol family)